MNEDLSISLQDEKLAPPETAPFIELRNQVIYPYNLSPIIIMDKNLQSCETAIEHNRVIATFPNMPSQRDIQLSPEVDANFEEFGYNNVAYSKIGTLCRVVKKLNFPDGTTRILARGISRIKMLRLTEEDDIPVIHYEKVIETNEDTEYTQALKTSTVKEFQELSTMTNMIADEFKIAVLNITSSSRIADILAEALQLSYVERLQMLTTSAVDQRMYHLAAIVNRNMQIMQLSAKIQSDVHASMSKGQREYFLHEQIKSIKKELGEDSRNVDIIEIEKRMEEKNLPEHVEKVIKKELSRLEVIPQMSPEYHVAYNYVDNILALPWNEFSQDRLDVAIAKDVLDEDHYGLLDVKERILEFLSVLQLNENRKAPILCLVGPPGVGKTSLGQSIARALDRKFIRIALGGVRDESEIRGHRRTYIGAMPGRIIQNLKKCGTSNPVVMLDEIDKLSSNMHGDPASALLEVLDNSQNHTFVDHYLDIEFDLSKIFFIATANSLDTIPAALLDRMEVVRLPGYTSFEKKEIAKEYLVKRAVKDSGLNQFKLKYNISAINELIDYYTREAGVRQLERVISQTCRKLARKIVDKEIDTAEVISVKADTVHQLLGARKFNIEASEKKPHIGSATGMAWTSVGGLILVVESIMTPGKGALNLTGSLGKVMQESAQAAFTYIKYRAKDWKIDPTLFSSNDFHINVPDGSTPKDGPSAGITLATALYSLLTNKRPKAFIAMTGEINLRGKITIIGGVKEKIIGALRSGVKEVILPLENKKDLEEIPPEIQEKLKFHFVSTFDEAIEIIF